MYYLVEFTCWIFYIFKTSNTYSFVLNLREFFNGRVSSAGKNFTGKINPDVILPVKLKFYWQNKSRSYSASKT